MTKALSFTLILLASTSVAAAQSTVTLDLDSLDFSDTGSETAKTPAPEVTATGGIQDCLLNPANCQSSEMRSGAAISLDDVQNLGVIDHENMPKPASTGTNTTNTASGGGNSAVKPATYTEPLPSIDMEILFDYNVAAIRYDQYQRLDELADILRKPEFAKYTLLFVGHTDAVGSAAYNNRLSGDRARSVADYVRSRAGLPWDRVSSAGMGFSRLKTPYDPSGPQNRRVQLVLVPR